MEKANSTIINWDGRNCDANKGDKVIVNSTAYGTLRIKGDDVLVCGRNQKISANIIIEKNVSAVRFEDNLTIKAINENPAIHFLGSKSLKLIVRKGSLLTLAGNTATPDKGNPSCGLKSECKSGNSVYVYGNLSVIGGNGINTVASTPAVQSDLTLQSGLITLEGGHAPKAISPVKGVVFIASEDVSLLLLNKSEDYGTGDKLVRISKASNLKRYFVSSKTEPTETIDKDSIEVVATQEGTLVKAGITADYLWDSDTQHEIEEPMNIYVTPSAGGLIGIHSNGVKIYGNGAAINGHIYIGENVSNLTFCGSLTITGSGYHEVNAFESVSENLSVRIESDGLGSTLHIIDSVPLVSKRISFSGGTTIFQGTEAAIPDTNKGLLQGDIEIGNGRVKIITGAQNPVEGSITFAHEKGRLDIISGSSSKETGAGRNSTVKILKADTIPALRTNPAQGVAGYMYSASGELTFDQDISVSALSEKRTLWGNENLETTMDGEVILASTESLSVLTINNDGVEIISEMVGQEFITGKIIINKNVKSLYLSGNIKIKTNDCAIHYLGKVGDEVRIYGDCPTIDHLNSSSTAVKKFGLFGTELVQDLALVSRDQQREDAETAQLVFGICTEGGAIHWMNGCLSTSVEKELLSGLESDNQVIPFIPIKGNLIIRSGSVNLQSGKDGAGTAMAPIDGTVTLQGENAEFSFGSIGQNIYKKKLKIYKSSSLVYETEQDNSLEEIYYATDNEIHAEYPSGGMDVTYVAHSKELLWGVRDVTVYEGDTVKIAAANCGKLLVKGDNVTIEGDGKTIQGTIEVDAAVSNITITGGLTLTSNSVNNGHAAVTYLGKNQLTITSKGGVFRLRGKENAEENTIAGNAINCTNKGTVLVVGEVGLFGANAPTHAFSAINSDITVDDGVLTIVGGTSKENSVTPTKHTVFVSTSGAQLVMYSTKEGDSNKHAVTVKKAPNYKGMFAGFRVNPPNSGTYVHNTADHFIEDHIIIATNATQKIQVTLCDILRWSSKDITIEQDGYISLENTGNNKYGKLTFNGSRLKISGENKSVTGNIVLGEKTKELLVSGGLELVGHINAISSNSKETLTIKSSKGTLKLQGGSGNAGKDGGSGFICVDGSNIVEIFGDFTATGGSVLVPQEPTSKLPVDAGKGFVGYVNLLKGTTKLIGGVNYNGAGAKAITGGITIFDENDVRLELDSPGASGYHEALIRSRCTQKSIYIIVNDLATIRPSNKQWVPVKYGYLKYHYNDPLKSSDKNLEAELLENSEKSLEAEPHYKGFTNLEAFNEKVIALFMTNVVEINRGGKRDHRAENGNVLYRIQDRNLHLDTEEYNFTVGKNAKIFFDVIRDAVIPFNGQIIAESGTEIHFMLSNSKIAFTRGIIFKGNENEVLTIHNHNADMHQVSLHNDKDILTLINCINKKAKVSIYGSMRLDLTAYDSSKTYQIVNADLTVKSGTVSLGTRFGHPQFFIVEGDRLFLQGLNAKFLFRTISALNNGRCTVTNLSEDCNFIIEPKEALTKGKTTDKTIEIAHSKCNVLVGLVSKHIYLKYKELEEK